MGVLVPGKKRFSIMDENGEVIRQWASDELDWKSYVVCETCNNTWMSAIENDHAKPGMMKLITGAVDVPIRAERARSISLFAFKAAIIFDHMQRKREPFFSREVRHEFRKSLTIPSNVAVWVTGYLPKTRGDAHTAYHSGGLSDKQHLDMYVFSFTTGHLCIQVVGYDIQRLCNIFPKRRFPCARIWPAAELNMRWPDDVGSLMSVEEFNAFSLRWLDLEVVGLPENTSSQA